jgi:Ni/Fe-hydrogenase b-type cytochrome subunit
VTARAETGSPQRGPTTAAGEGEYRWVYLWHWPIRAMHWVAAAAIVVLAVTGFYIGKPYFMVASTGESPFIMGWMRFLHFAAAALLVTTGIVRTYWLFAGNKFERWTALVPWRPREWVNLFRVIKKYLMIHPEREPHYLGHNPLQQLSYTGIYALVLVMAITGLALYGLSNPAGFFYKAFGWVGPLLGGWQVTRFIHHILAWAFIIFVPVHVYLGVRADVMDREGTMSSIFSGGRFVRGDASYEDD